MFTSAYCHLNNTYNNELAINGFLHTFAEEVYRRCLEAITSTLTIKKEQIPRHVITSYNYS